MIEAMNLAIGAHPLASALLSQGEPQPTFRRVSEKFEMEVQVRPDWLSLEPIEVRVGNDPRIDTQGRGYLVDLKSIDDLDNLYDVLDPESPRTGRPITRFGYYRQAGLAQWVTSQDIGETEHFLVFVEKAAPHRVAVVQMDGSYIDIGAKEVFADLQRLRACEVANVWPGSPEHVIHLRAPEWLEQRANREQASLIHACIPVGQSA